MKSCTLKQRAEIIKIHYKNGESLAVTVRKVKELLGPLEAPSRLEIQKLVKQFELLGHVRDLENGNPKDTSEDSDSKDDDEDDTNDE